MAHASLAEVQAWLEETRATLDTLDAALEESIASEVLSRVSASYDTSGWTTEINTPKLVRRVIAMLYASWWYQRQYSEEDTVNEYAVMLRMAAETLLEGIVTGANDLVEVEGTGTPSGGPSFELPASPVFTMGRVW